VALTPKTMAAAAVLAIVLVANLVTAVMSRPPLPHIGVILPHSPAVDPDYKEAFVKALGELGYEHGKSIKITWSEGPHGFPGRAEKLEEMGVQLMVVASTPAREAACEATIKAGRPIPIVIMTIAVIDKCADGKYRVTGSTLEAVELVGEQLELLQAVGKFDVVGVLINPDTPRVGPRYLAGLMVASSAYPFPISFPEYHARSDEDIKAVFAKIKAQDGTAERPKALMVSPDGLYREKAERIIKHALELKLPTMFSTANQAKKGGLLAYGQSYPEAYRRAAFFVDGLLKGREPKDLPFEGPSQITLAVNQKTAQTIGVPIPLEIAVRANEIFPP
jgi:putative tryptophan/tyrosine transport system substrate-binding protein